MAEIKIPKIFFVNIQLHVHQTYTLPKKPKQKEKHKTKTVLSYLYPCLLQNVCVYDSKQFSAISSHCDEKTHL